MAKLGDIPVHVEKESFRDSVNATEYAVERGEPFTDHIETKPMELTLSAVIVGRDYTSKVEKLREYMRKGALLRYVGRSTASDVVILDISRDYTADIANGVALSIAVRKIRIAKSPWAKAPAKQKPSQKPPTRSGKKKPVSTKPRSSTARYHVARKGDTYWGLSLKYGTSISQLRTWNRYADTRIPIGAKLRVK
jgi:LysM repeat protein